jgi:hypothetical protein
MKIACIGWGSLIWDSKNLLINDYWFNDGPILPLEFARQSKDGRLTLVIHKSSRPTRTLWALMSTSDINEAKISLCRREKIPEKYIDTYIGYQSLTDDPLTEVNATIKKWLVRNDIDSALWTNLPPKFNQVSGKAPTLPEVLKYLRSLDPIRLKLAKEYVLKAPKQIHTPFRTEISKLLNSKM